jgi:hypothetical protein
MKFMSLRPWTLGGLCLLLGACAARQGKLERYSLGGVKTSYHDYSKPGARICDAEPRVLSSELGGMNSLLEDFLSLSEKATRPESVDHIRSVEVVQEAAGTLEPVLNVHQANLQALRACGFAKSGDFPSLSQHGQELVEQSRTRLKEATQWQALAAAQRKWLDERPEREQTAKQTWCTKNPEVGNAELYYACKYADGRTEWLFCDGHKVESSATGGELSLVPPNETLSAKDRRKVKSSRYLEAARGYPAEEIDKQPSRIADLSAPEPKPATGGG